jgi:hypothetical protein
MKPYFLGLLFGMFLSFPGLLLRLAGALGAISSAMALVSVERTDLPDDLVLMAYIVVSALAFAFGSAMEVLGKILGAPEEARQTVSPRDIALMIALRTLALLGGSTLVVGIAYLARGMWWSLAGACACCGMFFLIGQALLNGGGSFFEKKKKKTKKTEGS